MAESVDISFHYPHELFQLLVDALPRLCRSKKDLMLFFRGAGISDHLLSDLSQAVASNPESINKFEITRTVLKRLNERGEATLRERRELLRRVVEFEDFSVCWPGDQAAAKGFVADIRRIVDVKDSFARMRQERDRERQTHIREREAQAAELAQRAVAREQAKRNLYALFNDDLNPHQRGRDLETALNQLFQLDGILIRESFRRQGQDGHTLEQIDGVVEIERLLYLVEMKWHKEPIGVQDVHVLLSKLFLRPGAMGIFISASNYTQTAIDLRQQAASQRVLLLCTLEEIVLTLEREDSIRDLFKKKTNQAIAELNASA